MSSQATNGTTPSRVEIPPHLQDSLRRLAASTHFRASRGWSPKRGPLVPADHVTQLALRNLCKVTAGRGLSGLLFADRADLTDLGREVAAMVRERRQAGGAN